MPADAPHCNPPKTSADALSPLGLLSGLNADVELPYDCVVDVGRVHDPERRIFDHKPPAFSNRNETCTTKLIWQHVRDRQISPVALGSAGWAAKRSNRIIGSLLTDSIEERELLVLDFDEMAYPVVLPIVEPAG